MAKAACLVRGLAAGGLASCDGLPSCLSAPPPKTLIASLRACLGPRAEGLCRAALDFSCHLRTFLAGLPAGGTPSFRSDPGSVADTLSPGPGSPAHSGSHAEPMSEDHSGHSGGRHPAVSWEGMEAARDGQAQSLANGRGSRRSSHDACSSERDGHSSGAASSSHGNGGSGDGPGRAAKQRRFDSLRKVHYNMKEALMAARALLQREDEDGDETLGDDDDDAAQSPHAMTNGQRAGGQAQQEPAVAL